MKSSTLLLSLLFLLIIGAAAVYFYKRPSSAPGEPTPTASSTPTPTSTFTATPSATPTVAPTATGAAGMQVDQPQALALVKSPLVVTGKATGSWYFEAQFPVKLLDANGATVAQGAAKTEDNWMTDALVPFSVTLTFSEPSTATGTLVLENDNPSGLASNQKSYSVPIRFK